MKTCVKDTSILAYKEIIENGTINLQEAKVLICLNLPLTSRQIAFNSGLERSSVCGRLNKLVEKNLVKVHDTTKCLTTGKRVNRYIKIEVC